MKIQIRLLKITVAMLLTTGLVGGLHGGAITNLISFKPFFGLGYSPFVGNQSPMYGTYPSVDQITADISNNIIHLAGAVTSYGMDGTLSNIAGICNACNVKCYPCAYVSSQYPADSTSELNALIAVANSNYPTTLGLVVGSEAILQHYDPQTLVSNMNYVRAATHGSVPVGTREIPADLLANPDVVANSDFVMADIYAYWGQIPLTNAAAWTIQQWQALTNAFPGKKIMIGEANWPTGGTNTLWNNSAIIPSVANQSEFLSEFVSLANSFNIEYFIFEYRDEPWKVQENVGTVEQNWGIIDANNIKKQSLVNYLSANFLIHLVSARSNSVQISVQTYEGNPYFLFGKTNLSESWGSPISSFIGAAGTNQTVISVTNSGKQGASYYTVSQNF